MDTHVEALAERLDDGRVRLCAPSVGLFTRALPRGRCVVAGEPIGVLITAGRAAEVRVPAGVRGAIATERPERVHRPVGYRDTLCELDPMAAGEAAAEARAEERAAADGALRSPQAGRFWRRASPDAPPLAEEGDVVEPGRPVGLIEVMKTFSQITWRAEGGLPERARIARFLVADGDEVEEGQPLLEVDEA